MQCCGTLVANHRIYIVAEGGSVITLDLPPRPAVGLAGRTSLRAFESQNTAQHSLCFKSVPRVRLELTREFLGSLRILSPVRLPFRHLGDSPYFYHEFEIEWNWSQIISAPSLRNFRDPTSRFYMLAKHRCGLQFPPPSAMQMS